MRKIMLFSFLFSVLFLMGCETVPVQENPLYEPLKGEWILTDKSLMPGMGPDSHYVFNDDATLEIYHWLNGFMVKEKLMGVWSIDRIGSTSFTCTMIEAGKGEDVSKIGEKMYMNYRLSEDGNFLELGWRWKGEDNSWNSHFDMGMYITFWKESP